MIVAICNPTAGNGLALKVADMVRKTLDARGLAHRVEMTNAPGHATTLAKQAVSDGAQRVLAIGGDGTAYEVSLGLAGTDVPLGIIPAGTGNDFIKAVGVPKKPEDALKMALEAAPKRTDMGLLNGKMFINVIGTGFDVDVLEYTLKAKKYVRGLLPYLYGVVRAIFTFRSIALTVQIDDGEPRAFDALICAVANGRYIGGGIPIAPLASAEDGLLDVVLIHAVKRWKMPLYLPRLLKGKVLSFPETEHLRAKRVTFSAPGMKLNIDGEIVPAARAEAAVSPGVLLMYRP